MYVSDCIRTRSASLLLVNRQSVNRQSYRYRVHHNKIQAHSQESLNALSFHGREIGCWSVSIH